MAVRLPRAGQLPQQASGRSTSHAPVVLFAGVMMIPRRDGFASVQLAHAPVGLVLRPELGIAPSFSNAELKVELSIHAPPAGGVIVGVARWYSA